jgi:ankyrin repeat protein
VLLEEKRRDRLGELDEGGGFFSSIKPNSFKKDNEFISESLDTINTIQGMMNITNTPQRLIFERIINFKKRIENLIGNNRKNAFVFVNAADADGRTALIWAASCLGGKYRDYELVVFRGLMETLLKAGANANAIYTNREGGGRQGVKETALMKAAKVGDEEAVIMLLKAGADPNITASDREGETALSYALEANHFRVVRVLAKADAGKGPIMKDDGNGGKTPVLKADVKPLLIEAAAKGTNIDRVRLLINEGDVRDLNKPDAEGQTAMQKALMNAVKYGNIKLVKLLSPKGTDTKKAIALATQIQREIPRTDGARRGEYDLIIDLLDKARWNWVAQKPEYHYTE